MESKESILNRWFLYKDPKDLSLLEALGKISEGKLLAKILQNLPKEQLLLICRTSKYIKSICDKYELIDRLYAGDLYIMGNGVKIPKKIFSNVIQVSCGPYYIMFITGNRDLYALKISNLNTTPVKINNISKVKQVLSSRYIFVITVDNELCFIEYGTFQIIFKFFKFKVKQISDSLTLNTINFITTDGDLYNFNIFSKEYTFIHKNVKQISRNDSFVTDDNYFFFSYFKDLKRYSFKPLKVKEICAGFKKDERSYIGSIITEEGDFKILDFKQIYFFEYVGDSLFIDVAKNVLTADCGTENYTFVTKDGKLYTFGVGELGNMGDGILEEHDVGMPFEVKNIPKVSQVSCGINFTAFITKSEFKLDINCQICGSVAKYHTDKHLFCGRECFNEFYSFDK